MHGFYLLFSAIFEAVWAVALDKSEGFTKLAPSLVFAIALAISMAGLAKSLQVIPVGTAYAVWVGVGASLTVIYSMVFGSETVGVLKLLFIVGIIVSVIGLKALPGKPISQEDASQNA